MKFVDLVNPEHRLFSEKELSCMCPLCGDDTKKMRVQMTVYRDYTKTEIILEYVDEYFQCKNNDCGRIFTGAENRAWDRELISKETHESPLEIKGAINGGPAID